MEVNITRKTVVLVATILVLVGGGYYFYQRKPATPQEPDSRPVPQTPPATSPKEPSEPESPSEKTDPTAGWIEYRNILEGVTLKLPPESRKPLWDNVGHSTKGTYLLGNTRLTISLRGEGEYFFSSYSGFKDSLSKDDLHIEEISINDKNSLEFSGKITAGNYSTAGANCNGKIKGVAVELGSTKYFVMSHTACEDFEKIYPERSAPNFEADEEVFELIISTLHFEEQQAR